MYMDTNVKSTAKVLRNTLIRDLLHQSIVGTQKYSTVWTGDNKAMEHLRMSLPMFMNLGLRILLCWHRRRLWSMTVRRVLSGWYRYALLHCLETTQLLHTRDQNLGL